MSNDYEPNNPDAPQHQPEDWGPWAMREVLVALVLGFAAMGLVAVVMWGGHLFAEAMRGFWR